MKISVILSTYNAPDWLEKTLWGYAFQNFRDFEVVIADDGSGPATLDAIRQFETRAPFELQHVWHEDSGFRKCEILNKAIQASRADYLVFSDGDCVPRADFLEQHWMHQKKGNFLSGGYCKLNMNASEALTAELIESGKAFDPDFLHQLGLKKGWFAKHCAHGGIRSNLLNQLTPTKPTWNGHNASAHKKDILNANGFDERMVYGGEDREFGERLENAGIRGVQIRYSAICLHLDHPRGYKSQEGIDFNKSIRAETREQKHVWTPHGINKSA